MNTKSWSQVSKNKATVHFASLFLDAVGFLRRATFSFFESSGLSFIRADVQALTAECVRITNEF